MKLKRFDAATWNCGLAMVAQFPESEALAKEAAAFREMPMTARKRFAETVDVLSFARDAATRYNLPELDLTGNGNAWGVALFSGKHIFVFRVATHWWAQTALGVLRIDSRCIVAAWGLTNGGGGTGGNPEQYTR
jgi:hypothetical protein